MNTFRSPRLFLPAIGLAAAIALSACGSSSSDSGSTTASSASGGTETVSTAEISGTGTVLVDSSGDALYSPAEESGGTIECVGECAKVWVPLVVSGGDPTASSDVSGTLATVKRPDGSEQVTLDGAPLYTFTQDGGPGVASGDGASDSFAGKSFSWHVVTADGSGSTGAGSTTAPSTTTSPSGGYSY